MDSDVLPRLDEHATDIDADAGDVWTALLATLDATTARPWSAAAAVSSAAPTPGPPGHGRSPRARPCRGSAWPARSRAALLALEGAHRYSAYALVFRLERVDGRTRLRAESRATFPGAAGRAYRLLVRGHGRARGRRPPVAGGGRAPRAAVDGAALSAV